MTTTQFIRLSLVSLACCSLGATALAQPQPVGTQSGAQAEAAAANPAPNITVEPPEWNFGTVLFGTPLATEVKVYNAGDAELKISNVRSSCGCTGSNMGKNTLAPGEATTLRVSYDSTKGRENVLQTIRVYSNDPDTPVYTFKVRGTCTPIFAFEPKDLAAVNFGQLDSTDAREESVTIKNIMKDKKVHLKLTRDEIPPYSLKLEEIEPGMVYKLSAKTHPPLQAGSQARIAYLETDLDFLKRLKIRLNGYVVPPVRVTPSVMYVSPKITMESKRTVLVSYKLDKPVNITKIECDDPRVKWETEDPPQGRRTQQASHRLQFTVPPGNEIPASGIIVKIHTDAQAKGYDVLTLPIKQQPTRSARSSSAARRAMEARKAQLDRERAQNARTIQSEQPAAPAADQPESEDADEQDADEQDADEQASAASSGTPQ